MAGDGGRLMGEGTLTGIDFEAMERACRVAALEVMGRLVANRLNAERSDTHPSVTCGCGGRARYVDRREKTFTTALGPMTLKRAWYHCAGCDHGFSAHDRALGFAGGSVSPAVRRMYCEPRSE